MPIKDSQHDFLEIYHRNFICIDDDDTIVSGTRSSVEGSLIFFEIARCVDKVNDFCKSEEEINQYFSGTHIMILAN